MFWGVLLGPNPVFSDVIEIAANSGKSNECFTHHAQPNSKEVQALFWAVRTHGSFLQKHRYYYTKLQVEDCFMSTMKPNPSIQGTAFGGP